jgi:hypothetical protein
MGDVPARHQWTATRHARCQSRGMVWVAELASGVRCCCVSCAGLSGQAAAPSKAYHAVGAAVDERSSSSSSGSSGSSGSSSSYGGC